MSWLEPITLRNHYCTLEPLAMHHEEALINAVKDGELWQANYGNCGTPLSHHLMK